MSEAAHPKGLKARLLHEVEQYGSIFLYLLIAFSAVLFYRDAVLRADGVAYGSYGFAVVKALVLAKFMMLGQAVRLGERVRGRRLVVTMLIRSLFFLLLLVALSIVEEALLALIHGRGVLPAIRGMGGGNGLEMLASILLLWVILLPYFAMRLIGEVLGKGELRRMFFGRG